MFSDMVCGLEGVDCVDIVVVFFSYRIEFCQYRIYCIQIFYCVVCKGGVEGVICYDVKLLSGLWVEEMLLILFGVGGCLLYVEF